MKREIIKQMIEIAGSDRAGDLSYDIMALANYDGQFVWSIYGERYTGLQKCSKELITKELNTERGKYYFANNGFPFMLQTWADSKFYWCGAEGSNHLVEITKEQAIGWCKRQYEEALLDWKSEGNEFPTKLIVGDLKINCPIDYLQEQLKYAEEHKDDSLSSIIQRLENRPRVADNHYLQIDKDCTERSFIFTEVVNGVVEMRGGIIFHGYPDEGYKENCSVQLAPTYGWQMHT